MAIRSTDKSADILLNHPELLTSFIRLGIRPGVGDETIEESSHHTRLHADAFVELINILEDADYQPQSDIQKYNILPLIDFIMTSHSEIEKRLQLIERHLQRLLATLEGEERIAQAISLFYSDFSKELSAVIEEEDSNIFPRIAELYNLYYSPGFVPKESQLTLIDLKESDKRYMAIEEKMNDLFSLLIRHIQGKYDETLYCGAYQLLINLRFEFQSLHAVCIKMLLPAAVDMMHSIKRKGSTKK